MALVRLSPGVYRDTATGKTVTSPNGQAPARPNAQQPGNQPIARTPGRYAGVPKAFRTEAKFQDYVANQNLKYGNANEQGPFGTKKTTYDQNGQPTVNYELNQDQQNILDQDSQLSQMGRQFAMDRFGQGGFNQQFNPQLSQRTSTGDLNADRARIEDEVFGRLTRTTNRDFDREKQQTEQDLYSRGIPMQEWANRPEMQALNERYDTLRQNARAQATELGGQEMSRSFGQNEQLIANQLSQQQGIRNQNLGELGTFAGFGTGLQVPNFQAFQGTQYNMPMGPMAYDLAQQELAIRRRAAANVGRGGGGGSSAESSPFVNSGPPGL